MSVSSVSLQGISQRRNFSSETSSVRRRSAADGDRKWGGAGGGSTMTEEAASRLSLPAVAYLQLPEPLPLTFLVEVARFAELLRFFEEASFWRATPGRIGLVPRRGLPGVVLRGGSGGGHVLGRAVL